MAEHIKCSWYSQFIDNINVERGYNGIAGIHAQDITKWSEFKTVLKQLASDKAKEMYHTVTIDTVGIAWELCEKFICTQNNVSKIGEIPWGKLHHCPSAVWAA